MTASAVTYYREQLTAVRSVGTDVPFGTDSILIDPDTGDPFIDPDTGNPFTEFSQGIMAGNQVTITTDATTAISAPVKQRALIQSGTGYTVTMRKRAITAYVDTPELPSIIVIEYYFRRPDTTSRYFRPDGTSYFVRAN